MPRAAPSARACYVRVNGLATGLTDADLDAIVAGTPGRHPAAEGGRRRGGRPRRRQARRARGDQRRCPTVTSTSWRIATETAAALFLAGTYGGASARLVGLTWGAEDLSAELGAEANRDADGRFTEPYQLARALCLAGAAAAQVQAIDTVYADFRNIAGLRRETEEARRDGFTGKMAIHPAQVPVINEVFTPTPSRHRARRRAGSAAFAAQPGAGTVGIDGVMFDRPHLERAQAVAGAGNGQPDSLGAELRTCACGSRYWRVGYGRAIISLRRCPGRHRPAPPRLS